MACVTSLRSLLTSISWVAGLASVGCVRGVPIPLAGGHDLEEVDAGPAAPPAGVPAVSEVGDRHGPITVCLTGAIDQRSGSNRGFEDLCRRLHERGRGVLRVRVGRRSHYSFATFPMMDADAVYPALFAALDADGDRRVSASECAREVDLLGFSWGGVNVVRLAEAYFADRRVDAGCKVRRLILLDAFQPFVTRLKAPDRVDQVLSFRHSIAPAHDCSKGSPLGPYLGAELRCPKGRVCRDVDYSSHPLDRFEGVLGKDVGHCDVPEVAAASILEGS